MNEFIWDGMNEWGGAALTQPSLSRNTQGKELRIGDREPKRGYQMKSRHPGKCEFQINE